jgi:hypothetical protein
LLAIIERDAVGLRMLRRRQTVFDAEVGAELVELMLTCGDAFAQTEQAVGEFLAAPAATSTRRCSRSC